MSLEKHGSCLCGAVKLSVSLENASVDACHCSMCRQWGGGPLFSVHCSQPVRFTAGQPVFYESSEWAERGFCGQCGTHLLYRLKSGQFDSVSVGVLEGDTDWVFDLQVYVDSKPAYYCFANQTKTMTGAEVEALFN
ncbi:aldehyde-activating protein [Pseudomonas alkylphenolica]|uniref:Aldehyde-activating protein n=1 Tax=Pseudomonas alkylphenolica TaxID=237609 RepID=A0A443ZNV7_9PSED|nr:GFA family protein [Pseudomonas alkylphenolica]RWU20779.1 aldehyde-activating protein [Pseudomonas alkylphenolica]